jgi:hypothetical protein
MNSHQEIINQLQIIANEIDNNKHQRILFCLPESAGDIFLSTSLLSSLSQAYPNFNIYFACKPEYKNILKNNPYIYKTISYLPIMENQAYMEGSGEWKGLFDISIMVSILTQRHIAYLHNGIGKIMFNLKGNNF